MARPKSVEVRQRREKAIRMRVEERSWKEITAECGYKNEDNARADISQALNHSYRAAVQDHRDAELAKISQMERDLWEIVNGKHILVRGDSPVIDPMTGERIYDDGPRMQAIDRLVKLSERRAKLLGIDQPDQVNIDHRVAVVHVAGVGVRGNV